MKTLSLLLSAATLMAAIPVWGSDFKDTKFGYSVSPPEFRGPLPGDVATRLNVLAPPEDGFAPNMGVMIQEVKITRDEFIARSKEQFGAASMKLRSSSKRDVTGQPAVLFEYDGQVRGHSLRFLQLAVILPERVVLLTYTAPVSTFAKLEPEFRRSLESFKLTPR